MPKIPSEGLCLSCEKYALELFFWAFEEELKKHGIPAALAKPAMEAALKRLYNQSDVFFVKAIDSDTAEYVQSVLREYRGREDEVRYPLVMRCCPKKKATEEYGAPPPQNPPPAPGPVQAQMPTEA